MTRTRPTGKHWIAASALLQPIAALPQPTPLGYCWPQGWQMMGGYWWMFPLAMFGLMVLVIALVALRGPWSRHHWHGTVNRSALALLGERFARGEISAEEFEQKKGVLVRRT